MNIKNSGRPWTKEPIAANAHDFRQYALCKTVVHGAYDVAGYHGFVHVDISSDTPQFAVDSIKQWWLIHEPKRCSAAGELMVPADAGGIIGYRGRRFKKRLPDQMADALGLNVTLCHFPSGASKWNPVEH